MWRLTAVNTTRAESWRFFEPRPGGGDPNYTFLADRLRVDLRGRWRNADVAVAVQAVGMAGLPSAANGPGALGAGALYFDQGGRRSNAGQLYLRLANVRFPNVLPGVDLTLGRMGYVSGAEGPSGIPKLEAIKRQRLDSRLVGEFEWSIYQRTFDGVRVDVARPRWRLSGAVYAPTQGGFARQANTTMRELIVAGVTANSQPPAGAGPRAQFQGFVWQYHDRRHVSQRPDNSRRTSPSGVEITMTTLGLAAIGAYPVARGELDLFAWGAAQAGDWYEENHRAFAMAVEGGYQWTGMSWRPWLRGGMFHGSGDADPVDRRHGTFFPMLPTGRRFSQTTAYATMNLRDVFISLQARPRQALGLRLDLRHLNLSKASDLWYAGSGATLSRGTVFGYAGRPSNGSTDLGSSVEISADYAITSRLSVNGFAGRMEGGEVVSRTFTDRPLWLTYVETVVGLGAR